MSTICSAYIDGTMELKSHFILKFTDLIYLICIYFLSSYSACVIFFWCKSASWHFFNVYEFCTVFCLSVKPRTIPPISSARNRLTHGRRLEKEDQHLAVTLFFPLKWLIGLLCWQCLVFCCFMDSVCTTVFLSAEF